MKRRSFLALLLGIALVAQAAAPISGIAQNTEHAKEIFQFITNSSSQFNGVIYTEETNAVTISGSANQKTIYIKITPTTALYTSVEFSGQTRSYDVKSERVVEFIQGLGYDFQ